MPTEFFWPCDGCVQPLRRIHASGRRRQLTDCLGGNHCRLCHWLCSGHCPDHTLRKGDNPIKRGILWIVKLILNIYVEFFRGTPMMAQAMFIYYGLMPLLNINSSILNAAYFILSINTGAYMAETVRGGIHFD